MKKTINPRLTDVVVTTRSAAALYLSWEYGINVAATHLAKFSGNRIPIYCGIFTPTRRYPRRPNKEVIATFKRRVENAVSFQSGRLKKPLTSVLFF